MQIVGSGLAVLRSVYMYLVITLVESRHAETARAAHVFIARERKRLRAIKTELCQIADFYPLKDTKGIPVIQARKRATQDK